MEHFVDGHRFQEREEPVASATARGLAPGWVPEQLLPQQTSGAQISSQKGEKPQQVKTSGLRTQSGTHRRFVCVCASVGSVVVLTSDLASCRKLEDPGQIFSVFPLKWLGFIFSKKRFIF